jgi:hypothetical protein
MEGNVGEGLAALEDPSGDEEGGVEGLRVVDGLAAPEVSLVPDQYDCVVVAVVVVVVVAVGGVGVVVVVVVFFLLLFL